MGIETRLLRLELGSREKPGDSSTSTVIAGYWALTKPDVNSLVAVVVGVAFCLASTRDVGHFPILLLLSVLLGTLLVSGGSSALNQYLERRFDARMRRTARRPLAAGTLVPHAALRFGALLSAIGLLYLATAVNALAALLALLASVAYLFVYTPLKRITPLCTLAGAFPGAMPSLIGWAGARGRLNREAWVLYSFLFLWQFPHFMAIAWMYRDDYARARYHVLPVGLAKKQFVIWQTLLPLLLTIPITLLPTLLGYAGRIYASGACLLSCLFLCCGLKFAAIRNNCAARRLLFASIVYLPAILVLLMLDRQ
jgi:protoheme IX farnesyltransferase